MNKTSTKIKKIIGSIIKYLILTLGALFTILPFVWMILSSLKTSSEIVMAPPTFFPAVPQWSNYVKAWNTAPFARYLLNTVIITLCSTCGVIVTTILSAFAFSRLNFPGKKLVFRSFPWLRAASRGTGSPPDPQDREADPASRAWRACRPSSAEQAGNAYRRVSADPCTDRRI